MNERSGFLENRSSSSEPTTISYQTYTLCVVGDSREFTHQPQPYDQDDTTNTNVREFQLHFDSPVTQLSCGQDWMCVLTDDGRMCSWGSNVYGQLGQGHLHPHVPTPKPLAFHFQSNQKIVRIACGRVHGGFVLETGRLFMFGCGTYGRLGTGNETMCETPTPVRVTWSSLLSASGSKQLQTISNTDEGENNDDVHFTDISCGDRHTLVLGALATSIGPKNRIISFGDGMNGRLGLGDELDRYTGTLITSFRSARQESLMNGHSSRNIPNIATICAGKTHNIALTTAGEVFTWGNGSDGQLGHGESCLSEWTPREVEFFRHISVVKVCCGSKHSLAVSRTGVVYAWGRGKEGQLGLPTTIRRLSHSPAVTHHPAVVGVPQRVSLTSIPSYMQHIAHGHSALPTGMAINGGTTSISSLQQQDLRVVVRSIAAKENGCMALDEHGRLFAWGENSSGQLGILADSVTNLLRISTLESPGKKTTIAKICHVATPTQIRYMDLQEHQSTNGVIVNTSGIALTHFAMSEHFSAFLIKTNSSSLGNAASTAMNSFDMHDCAITTEADACRISAGNKPDGHEVTHETFSSSFMTMKCSNTNYHHSEKHQPSSQTTKWQFSLADTLRTDEIPSQESAFYSYMTNYKVYIAKPVRPCIAVDNDDDELDGAQLGSGHGSTMARRRSSLHYQPNARGACSDEDQSWIARRRRKLPYVNGFDAWLQTHTSAKNDTVRACRQTGIGSQPSSNNFKHDLNERIETKQPQELVTQLIEAPAASKVNQVQPPALLSGLNMNRPKSALGRSGRSLQPSNRPSTACPSSRSERLVKKLQSACTTPNSTIGNIRTTPIRPTNRRSPTPG